ncbi:SDR family oxidoreductase [Paraburkholderia solisilvae]|uniref:3-oxoacyl-[acyl-carrier-protein] reductase FabG n=1 Tax=Paraburkholderia solisilvae TaxID=624376 RepID=A0A6J5D725_9BURK|nr:SDR family oxidoreductase [Paraburkholderia solisilvae]CAB3748685.1 3-oxoacyl-[acyl-carrier-protein] reductase FabG [Paraburkholderia solisilvae]
MDLGIAGRTALVCAASKGLGRGCAEALAAAGVHVVILARTAATLEATAAGMRTQIIAAQSEATVKTVACDITTPEGRAAALAVCAQPDILVTNAGGPPPGDFRSFTHDDWIRALEGNMLTPIELMRATIDGMISRGFGRVVNITSSSVKAPIDALGLSNGARSGLTGFVAGVARKVAPHGVTINNLLPGAFDTERIAATLAGTAQAQNISFEEARKRREAGIPARRFGTPEEFGQACAFLCSVHAGYITGQNLLIDGGAYPGTY